MLLRASLSASSSSCHVRRLPWTTATSQLNNHNFSTTTTVDTNSSNRKTAPPVDRNAKKHEKYTAFASVPPPDTGLIGRPLGIIREAILSVVKFDVHYDLNRRNTLTERFCNKYFKPTYMYNHARLLFGHTLQQSLRPEVFESFGIEDHVRGRHSLLLLHIWIVGYGIRSRPGPDSSKFLAAYFHHWWTHTDGELEEFGIKRIATRQKYLTEIQGGSHGSLLAFDKTFPLALEEEWESLYGAIFRCIHQYSAQSNHPINKEYLKAVGAYMLENVKAITQMTDEEFVFRIFQGHLSWNIPVASNREQVAKGRLINAQELALYCVSISPKPKAKK